MARVRESVTKTVEEAIDPASIQRNVYGDKVAPACDFCKKPYGIGYMFHDVEERHQVVNRVRLTEIFVMKADTFLAKRQHVGGYIVTRDHLKRISISCELVADKFCDSAASTPHIGIATDVDSLPLWEASPEL